MKWDVLYLAAFFVSASTWAADPIPVVVHYYRIGTESPEKAELQGAQEVSNSNPCVLKSKRETERWAAEQRDLQEATDAILSSFPHEGYIPRARLVLSYMNEAIRFQYELRGPPVENQATGKKEPGRVIYIKTSTISPERATWQERNERNLCHISGDKFTELIDILREEDRLAACKKRKQELLTASEKVNNYIHRYLPADWLREAQQKLLQEDVNARGVLRANTLAYRRDNQSYRECLAGLKLLEEEAATSVKVIHAVKASKAEVDVPMDALRELSEQLSQTAN